MIVLTCVIWNEVLDISSAKVQHGSEKMVKDDIFSGNARHVITIVISYRV